MTKALEDKEDDPVLELDPLISNKPIKNNATNIGSVTDFWGWAFSALYVPVTRGYFAEYIVFKSIVNGSDDSFRPPMNYLSTKLEKDEPDLITFLDNNKMTIQVKSIDSLKTEQFFDLGKSHGYNPVTDKDDGELAHHSDLFVLCFLELDKETHDKLDNYRLNRCKTGDEKKNCNKLQKKLNDSVLNMSNWSFYVFPSTTVKNQNSIRVTVLDKLVTEGKVTKCNFSDLHNSIRNFHELKVSSK